MPNKFTPDYCHTHQVLNQPTPLANYNAYSSNEVLRYWVTAFGGEWGQTSLCNYGEKVGGELLEAGFDANAVKPEFSSHDRFGHRVDLVTFHPSYHLLMKSAIEAGHTWLPWKNNDLGAHVVRAGIEYLHTQADPGSGCPLTMTFSAVPAIKHQPALAKKWLPKLLSNQYDERNVPFFEKEGVTIGMAMTEKQGGSDVRANTSIAKPLGEDSEGIPTWEIIGHKWFCSAPMCDAFLVTAHTEIGITCFLMPRWKPDGSKNPMQIQRLKDKVGNISNASSEVEFRGAFAWQVGEQGKGIKTILEMVSMTRFDCMVGSSSIMGLAVQQAIHHTAGRCAFGKNLHEQPLMQNVLADLALEAEAALAIAMRVAKALDNKEDDFVRLTTAIGKYWICKRAPQLTYEAMECIGAVGLIKDNVLSRLYTEAPVNAIWEGSGNVQCLDVLRAMVKEPQSLVAFLAELKKASGINKAFDDYLNTVEPQLFDAKSLEYRARAVMESLAILWQAATLLLYGEKWVADAFIAARIVNKSGAMYGTLPEDIDCLALIKRAHPKLNSASI
ncbi:DNA alkylation response protein [Alteromonas sediminis]|uniref:DNA alkylation response protein n=1 Tax=Alteromonas sediminis TaxID=2259342 RepID=A0A3N5Y1H1_9ALTE|nr:acyl-CoA dehydrogenase family protein [Alteromonas sediminis]RPJ66823.1 DNA alkylation response protein [Alteromonas sediminis]